MFPDSRRKYVIMIDIAFILFLCLNSRLVDVIQRAFRNRNRKSFLKKIKIKKIADLISFDKFLIQVAIFFIIFNIKQIISNLVLAFRKYIMNKCIRIYPPQIEKH